MLLIKSLLLLCPFLTLGAQIQAAEPKGPVISLSYGGYQTSGGTDTVTGSQLSITFFDYFTEHWSYLIRLSHGTASGQHTKDGESYDLSASTTTLSAGPQWSTNIDVNSDKREDLTPYLSAGLSVQRYTYDFDYQDSEVGKASGTGYGPFASLGLRISLSSNFVIIPGYTYEQISIETEEGEKRAFTSSGYSLALVARF